MECLDYPRIIIVVSISSLPMYGLIARIFFGDKLETLGEAIKYVLTPDLVSLFKGRYVDDYWHSFKFGAFLVTCVLWVLAISELIVKLFL